MYTHTTAAMISHTWFDSDFWYAPEAPVKCSAIDSGSPSAVAAARTACTAAPNDTPGAVSKPTVAAGYCDTRSTCSGDGCSTTCAKLASGVVVPLLVFTGSSCSVRRVAALSRAASRITRYWLVSLKMVETMRWPKAL